MLEICCGLKSPFRFHRKLDTMGSAMASKKGDFIIVVSYCRVRYILHHLHLHSHSCKHIIPLPVFLIFAICWRWLSFLLQVFAIERAGSMKL